MPINQYNQLGRSNTTPLSAYQYRNAEYQGMGFGQASPQNNYGQFNPNSTYNQSFELQSGGYSNNMQQYSSGGYDMNLGDLYNQTLNQSANTNSGLYNNISSNAGLYSAGLGLASSAIQSTDNNPYNQMYGTSGTSAAGSSAAALGGPVASVGAQGLGVIGTVADQAFGLQDYNEYGVNTAAEGKADLYQAGVSGLDQMGQLTKDIEQGDWWGALADSAGLSQLTGMSDYNEEQDAAKARQTEGRKLERQQKRAMREQTAQLDYQPTMMYADGGTVNTPNKVGGIVGYDTYGRPIYSQRPTGPQTASYTPNELRPRTVTDTRNTAVDTLGIDPNTFRNEYRANPQAYTDSIANVYPNKYKSEQNSLGNWTLSEYIANPNKTVDFQDGGRIKGIYSTELNNGQTHTMPDGTIMPGAYHGDPNAELESKEVFRTPDGSIEKVPEGTSSHKNGGVKMTLPEGTEILGKMKGKYTDGKRYKDLGQDLYKRYQKYDKVKDTSNSTLATKTADLMLNKINKEFDDLWLDQEIQKQYKSRYETKTDLEGNLIGPIDADYSDPQYAKGGKIPKYQTGGPTFISDDNLRGGGTSADVEWWKYQKSNNPELIEAYSRALAKGDYKGQYTAGIYDPKFQELDKNKQPLVDTKDYKSINAHLMGWSPGEYAPVLSAARRSTKEIPQYATAAGLNEFSTSDYYKNSLLNNGTGIQDPVEMLKSPAASMSTLETQIQQPIDRTNLQPLESRNTFSNTINMPNTQLADMSGSIARNDARVREYKVRNQNTGDFSGTLGTAAQLAPAAYNMYQGMFGDIDRLNASDYRNPYRNRIMGNLQDRKYNIHPELEANELAYQTARRNMRQVAPSTGNLMTNYTALAGSRMRADAGAYSRKQNMENQWRGQNAGIMARMGSQDARSRFMVDQYNQSSEAAKQSHLSTGLEQIGQSAYNWTASRNARRNQDRYYETLNSNMKNLYYDPITGQLRPKTI